MSKNKIKYVSQKSGDLEEVIFVGQGGVELIKDKTIEFKNSITFIYEAYDKDGKLLRTFINGTLDVVYF